MAGVVIGMTPNAALVATILYGWWSNHSYKSALVFAASSSFLGNVAYALALKHDSIWLVMVGRGLNGFGSARSINRENLGWQIMLSHSSDFRLTMLFYVHLFFIRASHRTFHSGHFFEERQNISIGSIRESISIEVHSPMSQSLDSYLPTLLHVM